MNYIILFCIGLCVLHFILYYLNIDILQLNKNSFHENHNNTTMINNNTSTIDTSDIFIDDSINELKKLNEYIDNECRNNAVCETV
jgi:hypothetical protein